jgi:transcriptional regulator with XRE-family HTH domain
MPKCHPLIDYRKRRQITLETLANELGVATVTLSRWEMGTRKIGVGSLPKVSLITGISKQILRPDLAAVFREPERVAAE